MMSTMNPAVLQEMKAQFLRDAETAIDISNAYARALGEDEVSLSNLVGKTIAEMKDPKKPTVAPKVRAALRRRGKEYSSLYIGVCWSEWCRKWQVNLKDVNGKRIHIGFFEDQEEAARAYNATVTRLGLRCKLNKVVNGKLQPKPKMSSQFNGVAWSTQMGKWRASICHRKDYGGDGKQQHFGYFEDERSAALAVDGYVRLAMPGCELNFPTVKELTKEKFKARFFVR